MHPLEPIDLLDRIRWGQNAIVGLLDPSQGYTPYWSIGFKDGHLRPFHHTGAWDRCHDVSRALHALGMVERTGEPVDEEIWASLADLQIALFDESDELPGTKDDRTGQRFIHLHNIRETTHGLTAMILHNEDERAITWSRRMTRRMLDAVDRNGTIHLDRLPSCVEAYTHQPHQEGRAVDALVRLYGVTGDEAALDLAGRMTTYTLTHCFTEEGNVLEEAGTHGHSLTAIVAGMLDFAWTTRNADLMYRVKKIYDVGIPTFNSSFGWSMESLSASLPRGESNNTGDLLRAALLLGQAGWTSCFEDAERILRGHLLPSQVLEVDDLSDDEADEDALHRRASRLRGGFGFPTPNDYLSTPDNSLVVYDITSGAVDGLCEALWAAVTQDETIIWVNLLLSREMEDISVISFLPRDGYIELKNRSESNVMLRIPSWVVPEDVRLTVNEHDLPVRLFGRYLLIPRGEDTSSSVVTFPVRKARTVERICNIDYTIDWMGDQIIAMSPPAQHRPMFPPCD
ncbi:MAG: hypothetical protein HY709_10500 [Candidatus Latescibacteria bacterium]|nr:hypothetical protein [Candidatus Latescibacterota bacterium]